MGSKELGMCSVLYSLSFHTLRGDCDCVFRVDWTVFCIQGSKGQVYDGVSGWDDFILDDCVCVGIEPSDIGNNGWYL